MKKIILLFAIGFSSFAQESAIKTSDIEINPMIKGTLWSPEKPDNKYLVIMIAGSGPTNRSGNQIGAANNSLKFLGEALAKNGIPAFSYDKRMFALMTQGDLKEESLSLEDFINDAKDVIKHFKSTRQYEKIVVAGHSEGALVGMVAAQNLADAFISLAGAGRSIDQVIAEQIEKQAPAFAKESRTYLAILKSGETFKLENQLLASLFRESVQPFMISWLKYTPTDEIKKLKMPVLIVNGTKDIQVKVLEAELLKEARPDAKLVIIENMNHVFKEINGGDPENMAAYNNPELPVIEALPTAVNQFIKSL